MKCTFCGEEFTRSRPDANRQNQCSLRCRLLSRLVLVPSGCMEWSGATTTKQGYGVLRVARKLAYAHRISYEIHVGPIPDGLWVLHRCDNPKCANPDHLFLGTHQDNMTDAEQKGRAGMSGKAHTKETRKKIRNRHAGKPPAWFSDQEKKTSAYAKAWETRLERYGPSGRSGKGNSPEIRGTAP